MRSVFKHAIVITIVCLLIQVIVSFVVILLQLDLGVETQVDLLPTSAFSIFTHNGLFILVYLVPLVGLLHFFSSFIFVFFLFSLSMVSQGVGFTLFRMLHLPLEIFSFAIPIAISNRTFFTEEKLSCTARARLVCISYCLLYLSALIEVNLR